METRRALETLGQLARDARSLEARPLIEELSRRRLSRVERLQLAFLAGNCGFADRTARLLHPVLHPRRIRDAAEATEAEKAEYARALVVLGQLDEGVAILKKLDGRTLPRVYRHLAWACFRMWDWRTPQAAIERMLASGRTSAKDRMNGRIVLGACLLHGQGDAPAARRIFLEVARETGKGHFPYERWDAHQLLAQSHYLAGEDREALRCLDDAAKIGLDDATGQLALMLEKWRALVELRSAGRTGAAAARLHELRAAFLAAENWEQARSCDFYECLTTGDARLATRLYFGTRHPAFRERLLSATGRSERDLPASYDLAVGKGGTVVHVRNGRTARGGAGLKPGQLPQRLLAALTSDFYAPFSLVALHSCLYPGEYYNPHTSYDRVKHAVGYLRDELARLGLPLVLDQRGGRCALASKTGVTLRVDRPTAAGPKALDVVARLQAAVGARAFGAGEAQELMRVSRPTAVAALNEAVAAGLLARSGNGPSTRYVIVRK